MKLVAFRVAGSRIAVVAFLAMISTESLRAEKTDCPCPKPPGGSHLCDEDQIAYCKVKNGECVGWCGSLAAPTLRGEKLAAAILSESFRDEVTTSDLRQDPQYRQIYQEFLKIRPENNIYTISKDDETVYFNVPPRTGERIANLQRQESGGSQPWIWPRRKEIVIGESRDDASITAAIKAKLSADGDINPFNIDVDTNEGVVTLTGVVAKQVARMQAERVARETDGVRRVINLIKVGDLS
jgi:hypothetical protein